jgi:CRP-like cAMP-binding protein
MMVPGTDSTMSTSNCRPRIDELPLSKRAGARQVVLFWEDEKLSEALSFLSSDKSLSVRDRVDGMLMDQRLRWQNGYDSAAEIYVGLLKRAGEDVSADVVREIATHELELHRHFQPNTCPSFEEFCRRFPVLRTQYQGLDETVAGTQLIASDALQGNAAADPTRLVKSKDDSTATLELTDGLQHTNIVLVKNDDDATAIEIDGDDSQLDTDEFVSEQEQTSRLGACHPFDQLPNSLVKSLEESMMPATYEVGEFLMREGEDGDGLFLMLDGEVSIRAGDEDRVLARVEGLAILGEMALLTDEPRTADVIAKTPVTGRFLPQKVFDGLATRYPVISRVMTQLFADRLGKRGHDALAGKQLDRFMVKSRLGRGGMAIVYQGIDTENNAPVALKMMSHRLVYDHRALRLFQSEARIIEDFDHPNIVKTTGRFKAFRSMFIAMEFCEGIALDEILHLHGPLDPDRFRTIFAQLASALAYAHEHNVVHRDIKPSNVMVSDDNVVKLMDFGLANPIDVIKDDGFVAGTPRYMAPEQAKAQALSGRADIFAFGCTAFRVLTGETVITGTSVTEAIEQHENWTTPDLSRFDEDIAQVLEKCLQVDEAKRDIDLNEVASAWSRKW